MSREDDSSWCLFLALFHWTRYVSLLVKEVILKTRVGVVSQEAVMLASLENGPVLSRPHCSSHGPVIFSVGGRHFYS